MNEEISAILHAVDTIGTLGIMVILAVNLWSEYRKMRDGRISDLSEQVTRLQARVDTISSTPTPLTQSIKE